MTANHTIALLGGTFDPIHYGHLRTAAEVRSALDFAEARLIPTGNPPHRPPPVASAEHRLAMTEIGCAEFPGLMADGREVRNPRLSYTVSTLQDLHSEQPKLPLALIVGSDAFANLIQWHHWEQLFTLAHLVVVERPGAPLDIESLPPALKMQWERRLTTDPARLSRQLAGAIYRQAAPSRGRRSPVCFRLRFWLILTATNCIGPDRMRRLSKIQNIAVTALEDIKARDIVVLDVRQLTSLYDSLVIATAESARQAKALANHVRDSLKASGATIIGVEGEQTGDWVLVDAGDIVVHVMQPAVRAYYNLEELWAPPARTRSKPIPAAA